VKTVTNLRVPDVANIFSTRISIGFSKALKYGVTLDCGMSAF